jgi:serine phosphatase RsbU (regulator of sigma subunit)
MCDYYNNNLLPDSSISKLTQALQIALRQKIDNKVSLIYDNLANAYFTKAESSKNKSDYTKVEQYAERALEMHIKENDSIGIGFIYGLLGATYLNTADYTRAEKYYKSAEEICIRLHDILGLKTNYEEMSDMYANDKKFDKAYNYRCKYDSINKLYLNGQSQQQVQELNTKYQTERKEQENQLLTAKNNLSDEVIKRQRLTVILIVVGLFGLFVASAFIFRSWKNQKKANVVIAQQRDEVELQKQIVEVKNKEITDSILYAKRIQNAMLTSEAYIQKCVKEYFCLYKPKDIVSGDFYWAFMSGRKFVMATADCTGHGVPGAMMSMLGINLFNHLVAEKEIPSPDLVLNELRKEIIKALNSEESKEEAFDGMDCALLVIDFETLKLDYASANSSFYILRNKEMMECKADKMPVGKSPKEHVPFQLKNLQLQKSDVIITLTDGYADQFGGAQGKKFKYKQLEALITENAHCNLADMKQHLYRSFETWKGKLEQVDDVCVIGIRV